MPLKIRNIIDKSFTTLTGLSALLMLLILILILGPMVFRGAGAVFFKGTVEFRKMQFFGFSHGDKDSLNREISEAQAAREHVYNIIDNFKKGIDTEDLKSQAKAAYRAYGIELKEKQLASEEYIQLRSLARNIRDRLNSAFGSRDREVINENINYVLHYRDHSRLKGTSADKFFLLARNFQKTIENINLQKLQQYSSELAEIDEIIKQLFGPHPNQLPPLMPRLKYGATRWNLAEKLLDKLLWSEKWMQKQPGQPLVKIRTSRIEQFEDTDLKPLFGYVEKNLVKMLKPKFNFYWRYFFDDQKNSHYFGGIGPEILGTLALTLLAMLFVFPLGIISAAYLVECASDNIIIRIIRMGINTLAGVPSIVFGLFGLAFFVLFFIPLFGGPSKPCILAASLTLAVLTLPVMIRASEEAIRSVPQTYKEASLGLGAGRFRTFVKVTLPAAMPGIMTGIILSLSRVAGETAPILFAGAVSAGPIPDSLFAPTRSLSYGSYDLAVGDRIAMMVPHKQYGMVVTLVLLIICLNALAIFLRARVFRKLKGH